MLIECPKCGAGFQVPERLLRDRTRPLRCGQCGTVFPMRLAGRAEAAVRQDVNEILDWLVLTNKA
ncbi:MAG: zinc-ribbon domain-containing protein, partial [Alphaproteobacteria bacterium]